MDEALAATEKENLKPELEKQISINSTLSGENVSLQNKVQMLHGQLSKEVKEKTEHIDSLQKQKLEIMTQKEIAVKEKQKCIELLEEESKFIKKEISVEKNQKAHLIDLLTSYSFDERCQDHDEEETIVRWLREIAEMRDLSIITIAQTENGNLEGGDGLKGIISVASEAIRTGTAVEYSTSIVIKSK